MNYSIIKPLPTLESIIEAHPLSTANQHKIILDRQEIKNILSGQDPRLLIIVGPCSAWPSEAVLHYATHLAALEKKVRHALKIIMRVYIQKPRSIKGWSGPINQPDPCAYPDIEAGLHYTRDMMIKVIEMGLPISDEAVYTQNSKGFLDLLSWVAIGARSSENQEHRVFASAIDCPVGLKNPTHGTIRVAVNSIIAAQHPHVTFLEGHEIQTHGNPFAHLVLRGSHDQPNYSIDHLREAKQYFDHHAIQNPAIIIDTSHANCIINGKKNHRLQPDIVNQVLNTLDQHTDIKPFVKGFMIESFMKEGNQSVNKENAASMDLSGLSITDPCLGWEETEDMLLHLAERMKS